LSRNTRAIAAPSDRTKSHGMIDRRSQLLWDYFIYRRRTVLDLAPSLLGVRRRTEAEQLG